MRGIARTVVVGISSALVFLTGAALAAPPTKNNTTTSKAADAPATLKTAPSVLKMQKPPIAVQTDKELDPAYKLSRVAAKAVRLQLDKPFYESGDVVKATLRFAAADPKEDRLLVHVVSKTKDSEFIILKKSAPGRYETEISNARIAVGGKTVKAYDGTLATLPGEAIVGLVFIGAKNYAAGANVVADMAIAGTNAAALPKLNVMPGAMTEAERASRQTKAPFGVVMARGGLPLEIALNQVVFTPNGLADLKSFLEYSGGQVLAADQDPKSAAANKTQQSYLVAVDPARGRNDRLADLRALFGETDDVIAGQAETLKTFALVMEYRMKGFAVSANPRLRQHGSYSTTEMRSGFGAVSTRLVDRTGADCVPGDLTCPINTPRLWAEMAVFDMDMREVPVAFIDEGFATASPDFRRPRSGAPFVECDFETLPPRCAPGVANTQPTVGASLVGERVWHGTGSVSTAGGVLNNSWTPGGTAASFNGGTAGPAGQVMTPMLYRMGLASYAFQMGAAITRATDDGASCINIAAGYPCNIRLTLVGDFELCNPAARAGACATLIAAATGAAATASAAACSTSGFLGGLIDAFLPGLGTTIAATTCGAVSVAGAATVSATVTACTALVALGDTRGPMQAGVDHATARGVPIVASMGNTFTADSIPPELQPFLDPSTLTLDGDQLKVVPATLRPVISVGAAAVNAAGVWANNEIRGPSVVVWAPEFNRYIAPAIGARVPTSPSDFVDARNHSGTSAASSYVAGVIAAMQAANPQLNPRTPGLSAAQRRAIPVTLANMLRSTATPMGTGTAEPARLPMVNAWSALNAAWGPWPSGFERALNFDDAGADDTAAGARSLGRTRLDGTIITTRDGIGGVTARDVDFYRVAPGTGAGASGSTFRVTLRFPDRIRGQDIGALDLVGSGWTRGADTPAVFGAPPADTRFRTLTFTSGPVARGASLAFAVQGVSDGDSVYTVEANEFPIAAPDRFDRDDTGNFPRSRPDNDAFARAVPIGVPSGGLDWPTGGSLGPRTLTIPALNFHDADDVDWFSFEDYPAPGGPGGGCVNRTLDIDWNGNVRYEVGTDESSMREVSRAYGTTTISISNPPRGLKLKTSRAPGSTDSNYELRITATAIAVPSGSPLCR